VFGKRSDKKGWCSMKKLLGFVLGISLALASTLTSAAAPHSTVDCNPAYVKQAGNVITVFHGGANDSANLQCAFDLAATTGGAMEVRLVAGTYYTLQVVVYGFRVR
jgi:hypothetical protein